MYVRPAPPFSGGNTGANSLVLEETMVDLSPRDEPDDDDSAELGAMVEVALATWKT